MKVKELIEKLSKAEPEAEVVLQKDAEGNGYSPLADADLNAVYVPETTWHGRVYSLQWSVDEACVTETEWAEIVAKPKCVVLHPVN